VLGSYYLFTHSLEWDLLLPATACGLLATAVLNINNVRDIETDAASGKITLAVRLGATGPSPITGSCWGRRCWRPSPSC
jgi:1,4-dihydroxy-2-naphthoate octaprenyltransferase